MDAPKGRQPKMTAPSTLPPVVWRVSAGALIPSFATIIFNMLNFFFEHFKTDPFPPLQDSVYDIGTGCAFSLVGICVASKDPRNTNNFLLIFTALLLIILGGELLVVIQSWNKFWVIWITNLISLVALAWALIKVE
jgi:hypothetical protein